MDSDTLLEQCLANDNPQDWQDLVALLTPVIWRVVWDMIGKSHGRAVAEDVSQESFLRLLRNDWQLLRRFDSSKSSLPYYVSMITRSSALDYLKRAARNGKTVSIDDYLPFLTEQEQATDDPQEWQDWQVGAALQTLGEKERAVIELSYRQAQSNADIAKKLGVAEATVRSSKRNALKKLRDFFSS